MRHFRLKLIATVVAVLAAPPAFAADCWAVRNLAGMSAHSDEGYRFVEDRLGSPITVCFTDAGGTVTGAGVALVRFGASTLVGYGGNERGNEMVAVYQLDRERGKILFTQTRIGTRTITPLLPDVIQAFVGDAVPVKQ